MTELPRPSTSDTVESLRRALDEATRELENRRSLYITRDATEAPDGIEAHIGHRLSLTGGEDAPLGLFCDTCGEYLIEWDG